MRLLDLIVLSGIASAGVAGNRRSKNDQASNGLKYNDSPPVRSTPGTISHVAERLAHEARIALSAGAPFKSQQARGESWSEVLTAHETPVFLETDASTSLGVGKWPKIRHQLGDVVSSAQVQWDVVTEGLRLRTSEAVQQAKAQLTADGRPWPSRVNTDYVVFRRTELNHISDDAAIEPTPGIANGEHVSLERRDPNFWVKHGAPRPRAVPQPCNEPVETRSADPTPGPTVSTADSKTAPVTPAAASITVKTARPHSDHGHGKRRHPTPAAGFSPIRTGI